MRAIAVFPETHDLRVIDAREPAMPTGSNVLLRIREVGICGTDREIASFHYGLPPLHSEHLILGHEALAEVVDIGPDVESVKVGDLVVPTVRRPCTLARCVACRAGRQDFCVTGEFRERGIKEADGFLTGYVTDEERFLVVVPPALADVGVLVEPLSVTAKALHAAHSIQTRLPWEPTSQRALILGAGPIGLLGAMLAVARGIETTVYSREGSESDRARLVQSFGARYISSREVDLRGLAARHGHFDIVCEAVGVPSMIPSAIDALGPNGVCVLTGVPALTGPELVDTSALMRRMVLGNQALLGTVNAGRAGYEQAVRALEQFMTLFPDAVRGLITSRVSLEDAPDLLRGPHGIKDVVRMDARAA